MHQLISKNLQSDFATMHRCMKLRQLQVGFAHDSAAESSTLIPRYHKILILCISRLVLFFFVQGSRWSVLWPEVLPAIIHMWSCIAWHRSVSLFIIISEHGLKSKAKKKRKHSAYAEPRELRGLTPFLGCLDLIINNNGSCSFPTNTYIEKVFTISCCCCLCFVSNVMLACLHNMAVTVSPLRLFIFYVFSNTLSEHLSSFLCMSLCFLFMACIARKITSSYTNFRRRQKWPQEEGKVKKKKKRRRKSWSRGRMTHTPSIFSSKLKRQSENQRGETELNCIKLLKNKVGWCP